MKRSVADILVDFSGDENLSLYEGYSGRGMYGDTTDGVVGSHQAFNQTLAEIIRELPHDPDLAEEADAIADALRNLQQDSMGRDRIWY